MAQIEVITGADRRRSFTLEEKQQILAEAFAPGVNVKAFCRRRDIASSSLYTWRAELARLAPPAVENGFARVMVTESASQPATASANRVHPVQRLPPSERAPTLLSSTPPVAACELPAIEIEVRGNKVRIPGSMPPALATAVLRALVRR